MSEAGGRNDSAEEIRTGLAWLHSADPVLAQVIDDRPDFDPDVWMRKLPAMVLFGALVFQIIGQQISVIDPAEVADLARHWRPYRSLASSLLLAAARSS